MECNKEEARRAMDIAKKKLSEKDYVGAKKFIIKAHNLYPNLDGLKQVCMMIDADSLSDEKATMKKQYKNKRNSVFNLVSDKFKRIAYEQNKKSKEAPYPQKPVSNNKPKPVTCFDNVNINCFGRPKKS